MIHPAHLACLFFMWVFSSDIPLFIFVYMVIFKLFFYGKSSNMLYIYGQSLYNAFKDVILLALIFLFLYPALKHLPYINTLGYYFLPGIALPQTFLERVRQFPWQHEKQSLASFTDFPWETVCLIMPHSHAHSHMVEMETGPLPFEKIEFRSEWADQERYGWLFFLGKDNEYANLHILDRDKDYTVSFAEDPKNRVCFKRDHAFLIADKQEKLHLYFSRTSDRVPGFPIPTALEWNDSPMVDPGWSEPPPGNKSGNSP
ncbi:MAG: hypothetical protein HQL56_12610 [Magnetococcales bacterium]|nr:hypothetical protein [Magnetococcales bacterium]